MKRSFFQVAVAFILLYGCTTWTLTKRLEKKLDGNCTRMLRAILNKSWRQHPTRHQLYGHLPPIMKTIQVRRTRHAGHCWRSRDELISDVLLWTPTHGQAKAGRPAWTYIQPLCEDTGCSSEDLPEAMNDREKWWERVRDICATSMTWWWWWCNLLVWRDLAFKIFHNVKTLFMKRAVSFLSTLIPDWVKSALYEVSENNLRQGETCCLSIGFGAMEILFKSESLTSLSDSKWYNCLRCAYLATRITSLSKICSVFSVGHKLWIFFNWWT